MARLLSRKDALSDTVAQCGFGRLLRQWRQARGMTQLALATDTDISIRHLSFLETAAGYAPLYGERDLESPELEPVRRALQFILRQQEPYPAIVLDSVWNVMMSNAASRRIFDLFRGTPPTRRRSRSPRVSRLRPSASRSPAA